MPRAQRDASPPPADRPPPAGLPGQLQPIPDAAVGSRPGVHFRECTDFQRIRESVRVRRSMTTEETTEAIAKNKACAKRRLFPDKTELIHTVQQTLVKPEFRVADLHRESGFAQTVARHPAFESATLGGERPELDLDRDRLGPQPEPSRASPGARRGQDLVLRLLLL